MSCLPPSQLSSLQQAILLPLKGQLLSHAEPHVGDFRLNKAPLVLPLRSPPHSSPNTELPAASQGLAPRTEGEGTAGQGLRHSLLGWEVGSQPGIASRKTQTELEFQGQGRQKAEAEWPEGGGGTEVPADWSPSRRPRNSARGGTRAYQLGLSRRLRAMPAEPVPQPPFQAPVGLCCTLFPGSPGHPTVAHLPHPALAPYPSASLRKCGLGTHGLHRRLS